MYKRQSHLYVSINHSTYKHAPMGIMHIINGIFLDLVTFTISLKTKKESQTLISHFEAQNGSLGPLRVNTVMT